MNSAHVAFVPPRSRSRSVAALFAFLGALPSACVYDESERCGAHQVFQDRRCICDTESAWTETGCVTCGADEVPGATGCMCKSGYSKPQADGVCEPIPMGLGSACETSTQCAQEKFDHCEVGLDGKGYCTNTDCSSPEDCSGGYACDMDVTPSICRRPPLGSGQSCSTPADCAGTEATYCDAFLTHRCLVEGCSLSPNDCFSGTECCDLSAFGVAQPVCVAQGGCSK
jgi:hypothetical protein